MVIVHHEGRKAEVPLGGSRQTLDPRVVRRVCEELGLDWFELPGPKAAREASAILHGTSKL